MRAIRRVASSVPELFGFAVLALILSTADCRFNRVKAQDDEGIILKTKWCNQAYLESIYGEDWHIYWALEMCWLYTEPTATHAATPTPKQFRARRFVVGGR